MTRRLVPLFVLVLVVLASCSAPAAAPDEIPASTPSLVDRLLTVEDLGAGWTETISESDRVVIDGSTFIAACDTEYSWVLSSPAAREIAMKRFERDGTIFTQTIIGGVRDAKFEALRTVVEACDGALAYSWIGQEPVQVFTSLEPAPAERVVMTRLVVAGDGWETPADQAFAQVPGDSLLIVRLTFVSGAPAYPDLIPTAIDRVRATTNVRGP